MLNLCLCGVVCQAPESHLEHCWNYKLGWKACLFSRIAWMKLLHNHLHTVNHCCINVVIQFTEYQNCSLATILSPHPPHPTLHPEEEQVKSTKERNLNFLLFKVTHKRVTTIEEQHDHLHLQFHLVSTAYRVSPYRIPCTMFILAIADTAVKVG